MSIRIKILIACGLTLVVAGLLTFGFYVRALDEAAEQEVLATARAFFQQIVITRRWVARQGGVFVAKQPGVETNPYLLEIPGLVVDVTDTQGQVYTLRNPALVTRELSALAAEAGAFQFHITSLRLLNPDNAPDEFEIEALRAFERGEAEVWSYEGEGDQRWLRYMAPLYVEQACLRCHGIQGYSVGDVRGGISVTVPAGTEAGATHRVLALGWALGTAVTLGILFWALNATVIRPIERLRAAADSVARGHYEIAVSATTDDEVGDLAQAFERMRLKVRAHTQSLAETVRQRTAELEEYSERLEERVEERTRELREAQEQLVRREKLAVLGQLAGTLGHELRNPLGVIANAVYYLNLVQPDAGETVKEYLDLLSAEVGYAEKIISDLLGFARIPFAAREPVTVSELVASVLERYPPPEGVEVSTEIPPDLPPAFVDARQIEQVLGNVVTNAYQAMPEGGRLSVTGEQCSVISDRYSVTSDESSELITADRSLIAGNWLLITVRDTGVGIAPEHIGKLFEPLFTTRARGTGLGLALSRNLVEANDGRIEVESEVGKGSAFMVWLPTVRDQ